MAKKNFATRIILENDGVSKDEEIPLKAKMKNIHKTYHPLKGMKGKKAE
ncbi:MAG: hypothetical protein WC812_03925 [Candidatus Pacearchaeota archaeon]|jgi:hypothetical protein